MVNLTLIGSIIATTVVLSGLGYYYMNTKQDGDLFYGTQDLLTIPESEMSIMERNFKRDGGFIKHPGNWKYKEYSTPFNGKCRERPYAVFMPGSYENAQEAMIAFKAYNQAFTIMGGGHDFECVSMGKAALLNLGLLNGVTPNFEEGTVTVQAGARWSDVYPYIFDTGFEVMGGQCPAVGVSGFVLGGGFNWKLSPLYGSGAQNVIEMKAVLENGLMVTLTRNNEYKDLMWGMLGAGGMNFGMGLEYKLKLHSYPELKYNWMFLYSTFSDTDDKYPGLDVMVETIKAWVKFFDARRPIDGYGGNTVAFYRDGTVQTYIMIAQGVCRDCKWEDQIKEIQEAHPLSNTYYMDAKWSWGEYATQFPEGEQISKGSVSYPGIFLSGFTDSSLDQIVRGYVEADLSLSHFQITTFESILDKDDTSFPFPQAKWKLASGSTIFSPEYEDWRNSEVSAWKELVKTSAGRKYLGEYINYIDFNTDNYEKDYFGNNLKKLKRVKDKYDPDNFFKRPFGVPASN